MGSGARVQRVVQKAMAGLPVTISVLGGSGTFFHMSEMLAMRIAADPDPQYLHATVQATTLYRPDATQLSSSTGGTRFSPTLLQN